MDVAAILAAVFAIVAVSMTGVASPGPMLAVTITTSSRVGFKAGPLVALGHVLVEAPFVAAMWVGLGEALKLKAVDLSLSLLGAIFLMYLGACSLRAKSPQEEATAYGPLTGGIVTTAFNPLFIAWWIALGPVLIPLTSRWGLFGLALLLLAHCPLDIAWCSLISAFVARGGRFLSERVMKAIVYVCGFILLAFGAYFLSRAAFLIVS